MKTIAHLKYKLEQSHSTPQTQIVPGYNHIQLLRSRKNIKDLSLLNKQVYYLDQIKSPIDFVNNHKINLLHTHHGNLGALMMSFARETKLPLVCSFRGKDTLVSSDAYKKQLTILFDQGLQFYPVCNYLAKKLIDLGCPEEKVKVLYGGINLNKFKYKKPKSSNTFNILSIGRLVEKKGHLILIQAFARIKKEIPNSSLTIIGNGKMKKEIERIAKRLRLGNSFKLIDDVHYDDLPKVVKKYDIFCGASFTAKDGDTEGIPNTLKEAMALGIPVISTNHAGIPELISHLQNGLLVKENNVKELEKALLYLHKNRNIWNTLSSQGRCTIEEKFNLEKQLELQARYYDEVLAKEGEYEDSSNFLK